LLNVGASSTQTSANSTVSPEKFFRVYAKLDNSLSNTVDLVDFDESEQFYALLNSLGEVAEIG
jgi:hypothetical protein